MKSPTRCRAWPWRWCRAAGERSLALWLVDEGTLGGAHRGKRLVTRNRCDLRVVVPRILRFGRLLDLVQRQVVHETAVGADASFLTEILHRRRLHRFHDVVRVVGPGDVDGAEIVRHGSVGG